MAKSIHKTVNKNTKFWTKTRAWLVGLASVVGITITILSQILDFWDSRRPENTNENFPTASSIRQMTNNEVVEYLRHELLETRMEIAKLIIIYGGSNKNIQTDSVEIQIRPQPSRSDLK